MLRSRLTASGCFTVYVLIGLMGLPATAVSQVAEARVVLTTPSGLTVARTTTDATGGFELAPKQAGSHYHGEFNFLYRNSSMAAQQRLSPSKPPESRSIYEGDLTGPLPHLRSTMFLLSVNRQAENLDAVVNATVAPTPENPLGVYNVNVPAPTRDRATFTARIPQRKCGFYACDTGEGVTADFSGTREG